MTTYVALLRGINLGANNRLPMARLREMLTAMDASGVRTLLQSGNAVFEHAGTDPDALAAVLTARLADEAGLTVPCVVRELADLERVVRDNPFADTDFNPAQLVVVFLSGAPDTARLNDIDPDRFAPDEFRVGEREIYVHCPTGLARSKLPIALSDKRLGVIATARNWNTVTKLALMTDN
ncbi:DUF1697 domain-containing protein [Streptomyces sp. ICBB 8177]|uniref:DUF1697 domain-containing protein n=1 Tax=Streptomyces sp. ICBB 8177 TaxID=563922 RepID=UPI000D6838D3|nr:DUF1697 domain-containing protein [Streptomyces sp. ICBB 8177]PWI41316.1 hypothetical protein CK485_20600 [Streptomyces sp. ICBB 8177]